MSTTPYVDRWINKVERFNVKFPPGTPVIYTALNGIRIRTSIRYPAVVLSDGVPVIWLKNIREYVCFDRVECAL
jgi:hypothetical protein